MEARLTPRRREALEILAGLNRQAGEAVHYSLVGARMKISAWTAYGLLRELEAAGLVVRSYALDPGRRLGGRSRILFAATATAAVGSLSLEEARSRLRAAFDRFAAIADERAAGRAYLKDTSADLAYQLGFWLSRLETAGRSARNAAQAVLDGTSGPRVKAQTLASMALGASLARLQAAELGGLMAAAGARFSSLLGDAGRSPDAQLGVLIQAARDLRPLPSPRRSLGE